MGPYALFDVVVLASPICGLIMVIGSMFLLHKGIITLSQASKEQALSIEFKKTIKISSHYPAIALFMLGGVFVFTPIIILSSAQKTFAINGTVYVFPEGEMQNVRIKLIGGPWGVEPGSDGSVNGEISPSLKKLRLEVSAPGHPTYKKTLNVKGSEIILGDIKLNNAVVSKSGLVKKVGRGAIQLPSLNSAGQGGMK